MNTYWKLGAQIGALTDKKNDAYGSSFTDSAAFMALLYPDGIPVTKMADALLLVRVFDKMKRIATDRDAFGESPWQDIAGYGLLGVELHQRPRQQQTSRNTARENETRCDSASDQAAPPQSKAAQHDSAEPSTAPPTSPIVNANDAPTLSQQPSGSSPSTAFAPAATATEDASQGVADRATLVERAIQRNKKGQCGNCPLPKRSSFHRCIGDDECAVDFCTSACRGYFDRAYRAAGGLA